MVATKEQVKTRPNYQRVALVVIVAVGVALRVYGLNAHPLSYDEAFTALVAYRPWGQMLQAVAGDVHPPLSYTMYWLVAHLFGGAAGVSNGVLRLPALALGLVAIFQVNALARRLRFSDGARLAAVAVFACSPFEVAYSQDARMYALLQCLVLAAWLAALDRRYVLMALAMGAALWTHYYAGFYIVAIAAVALVDELMRPVFVAAGVEVAGGVSYQPADQARPAQVFLAVGAAGVAFLPWVGVVLGQVHTLSSGYWIAPLSLGQVIYPLFVLAWGNYMPEPALVVAAGVVYGLVLWALLKSLRLKQNRVLAFLVIAPALLGVLVSLALFPIYLFRALIGLVAPLVLLVVWAVTERTKHEERLFAGLVVGVLVVIGLSSHVTAQDHLAVENNRALAVVLAGWQSGDIVYHGNVGTLTAFEATGPRWLPNYLMPVQPGSVGVLTEQTRRGLGFCEGPLGRSLPSTCGPSIWRRAWLIWGASQTISGVEDTAIAALLAKFPNQKLMDIHELYLGPMPVDGGIWLLQNPEGQP